MQTKHIYSSISFKIALCFALLSSFALLHSTAQQTICANESGNYDGFSYELWKQVNSAGSCMTLKSGCQFSCEWREATVNFLARRGLKYDETLTPSEIGNFTATYACDYNPSGNSYLGIYGWTTTPLVEFYIIESWGTWRPPGATSKGKITVDGGNYDIYETTRVNQPSIKGTTTFQQYWSVRTVKRTSGSVSISQHFAEWENFGMNLGYLYDINLLIEGYKSSGKADFTTALVEVNEDGTGVQALKSNRSLDSSVEVYCKPVSDMLNVTISKSSDNLYKAVIYNSNGIEVKKVVLFNGKNTIDVSALQQGMYLVRIDMQNEIITRKFMK